MLTFASGCCDVAQGIYLVAEDANTADAWVDALILAHHLVMARSSEALAEALAPQASRRTSKQQRAVDG